MIDFVKARQSAYEEFNKGRKCSIINSNEQKILGFEGYKEVWEVNSEILDSQCNEVKDFTFYICFSKEFPLEIPKIFLSNEDYKKIKYIPHVDTKRLICTYDNKIVKVNPDFPSEIVEICFNRACKIIEDGISGNYKDEFEQEFIAYWEDKYSDKDNVTSNCLSIISDDSQLSTQIPIIFFQNSLRGYDIVIHSNDQTSEQFKEFLLTYKIKFEETDAFFIKEIDINAPPFNYTNKEIIKKINSSTTLLDSFKKYINKSPKFPFVVFKKVINNSPQFFAWRHNAINTSRNGFRPGKISPFFALSSFQSAENISRFKFDNITPGRLEKRTTGFIEDKKNKYTFTIAGLGSIGSNLLYFLNSLKVNEFKLIDPDILVIENIQRHLLGLSDVKFHKTVALKGHLQWKNPLLKVSTRELSIIDVLENEPKFINESDYLFISIGNENIEEYIGDSIQNYLLQVPTFFIWVEPYLCGGHLVYVNPKDCRNYSNFFKDGLFKYNIIDKEEYIKGNELLSMREAGCQSSFTPYSETNVILFLSRIYPIIYKIISENIDKSSSYTWIGDTTPLKKQKLKVSKVGLENKIGNLIEN